MNGSKPLSVFLLTVLLFGCSPVSETEEEGNIPQGQEQSSVPDEEEDDLSDAENIFVSAPSSTTIYSDTESEYGEVEDSADGGEFEEVFINDPTRDDIDEIVAENRIIPIAAQGSRFFPSQFQVLQGEKVTVMVTGIDADYSFEIPELHVQAGVEHGKATEILLPTDEAGTFTYQCSGQCGEGAATMKGQVIIYPRS